MSSRYRYGIVTRADGTFGLDFHADVDPEIDKDAREQLDALGGPSSLAGAASDPIAPDGLEFSGSPDARAMFAEDPPKEPARASSEWDMLRSPLPFGIRRLKLTDDQRAADESAREELLSGDDE